MSDELNKLYTSELIRRGLGDADYIGPYGITTPPKRKIGEIGQGILSGIEKIGDFTEFLTSPKVGLPKKITDNVVVPAYEYLMSPSEIAKQKAQEKNNSTTKSLPLDELFYSSDSFRDKEEKIAETQGMRFDPVDLTEQIKNLIAPSGAGDGAEAQKIIAEKKAKEAIEEQMTASAEAAGEGALSQEVGAEIEEKGGVDAFGKLFQESMDEFNQNVRGTSQKSQSKTIDDYKKEFAAATGIDVSGKVDKSAALMSLGLALMQNRAGKGFNVGRILSSVGEAGEKALPALEKAKSEAKQAQLAAGKYALNQVAAGKAADAAFAKEARAAQRAYDLKLLEIGVDLKKEEIKAGAKGTEYKNVKAIQPVKDLDIHWGTKDGQTVLAKPSGDAARLASTFNAYTKAQTMLNQMQSDLEEIAAADSPTLFKLEEKVNGLLVGFGLKDAKVTFGDDKISLDKRVARGRQSIINEFKRALLQESQVSDLDLNTLFESLGKQGIFDNPNEPVQAISNMIGYFSGKKNQLSPIITQFRDEYYYRNDEEFKKTQEILDKALNNRFSSPKGVYKENRSFVDLTNQEGSQ